MNHRTTSHEDYAEDVMMFHVMALFVCLLPRVALQGLCYQVRKGDSFAVTRPSLPMWFMDLNLIPGDLRQTIQTEFAQVQAAITAHLFTHQQFDLLNFVSNTLMNEASTLRLGERVYQEIWEYFISHETSRAIRLGLQVAPSITSSSSASSQQPARAEVVVHLFSTPPSRRRTPSVPPPITNRRTVLASTSSSSSSSSLTWWHRLERTRNPPSSPTAPPAEEVVSTSSSETEDDDERMSQPSSSTTSTNRTSLYEIQVVDVATFRQRAGEVAKTLLITVPPPTMEAHCRHVMNALSEGDRVQIRAQATIQFKLAHADVTIDQLKQVLVNGRSLTLTHLRPSGVRMIHSAAKRLRQILSRRPHLMAYRPEVRNGRCSPTITWICIDAMVRHVWDPQYLYLLSTEADAFLTRQLTTTSSSI
jgi:hypothetical protein